MFGKPPKETNPSNITDLQDALLSSQPSLEVQEKKDRDLLSQANLDKSETVNTIDKISGILSPYFIVLVGLFLYEDNVLVGTLLIAIGILSLLKVSWKDIGKFFEKIKKLLGLQ
jgi:hypothetical protein